MTISSDVYPDLARHYRRLIDRWVNAYALSKIGEQGSDSAKNVTKSGTHTHYSYPHPSERPQSRNGRDQHEEFHWRSKLHQVSNTQITV